MKTICAVKIGSLKDPDESKRGKVAVLDMPEQEMYDEGVKIRVSHCAICGSDPHLVEGIFGWEPPFGLGHEISGIIEEIGPKVDTKGLKVGDHVAGNFLKFCGKCYYCLNGQEQFCTHKEDLNKPGMAEYVVWHEAQVWKIPDSIPLAKACLLEPVSVAVRIVDKLNMKIGQRVAVQGGGPIGLITLQLLKKFGATSLTLIEPIESRRQIALKYGADHVIDPTKVNVVEECKKITGGLGFDCVVEASGFAPAAKIPVDIAAYAGTVLYIAMFPGDFDMPFNLYEYCYCKELTVSGTNVSPYAFPRSAQLLDQLDLDDLCSTVFSLDQAEEAFAAQVSGKYPKILIKCNDL